MRQHRDHSRVNRVNMGAQSRVLPSVEEAALSEAIRAVLDLE
nr:hypothetical protein [Rhodococcus sp. 14C212]